MMGTNAFTCRDTSSRTVFFWFLVTLGMAKNSVLRELISFSGSSVHPPRPDIKAPESKIKLCCITLSRLKGGSRSGIFEARFPKGCGLQRKNVLQRKIGNVKANSYLVEAKAEIISLIAWIWWGKRWTRIPPMFTSTSSKHRGNPKWFVAPNLTISSWRPVKDASLSGSLLSLDLFWSRSYKMRKILIILVFLRW